MLKYAFVALFVVFTLGDEVCGVSGDEYVQLIVNRDDSSIPHDILGVDVNKIENGVYVKSKKLFPIEPAVEIAAESHKVIETPIAETSVDTPVVDLPVDIKIVPLPIQIDDIPEESIPGTAPVEPIPSLPIVETPSVDTPIVLPDEVVVAPVEEVAEEKLGQVYNDDLVSVTVNADEGIISRISSWMSMIINKITGSSQESVKVI